MWRFHLKLGSKIRLISFWLIFSSLPLFLSLFAVFTQHDDECVIFFYFIFYFISFSSPLLPLPSTWCVLRYLLPSFLPALLFLLLVDGVLCPSSPLGCPWTTGAPSRSPTPTPVRWSWEHEKRQDSPGHKRLDSPKKSLRNLKPALAVRSSPAKSTAPPPSRMENSKTLLLPRIEETNC